MGSERSFISFSFDDFPVTALEAGGAILERHGLKGTFYASLGLMGRDAPAGRLFSAEDLKAVLASGNELGCHTYSHCHAWDTPGRVFEESLVENQRALSRVAPGEVFRTMSYPISCPHPRAKVAAAKYFACCRGGGQGINAGLADLNNLNAFFLDRGQASAHEVWDVIDRNQRERGWLILATHDVADHPSRFGCTPALLEEVMRYAVNSRAVILPVARVWEAIRGAKLGRRGDGRPVSAAG